MPENKLQKLNNYFAKYIDGMIVKDIELLEVRNDEFRFSYPYIMLVCSCIDLFGGIEKDFKKPDGKGNSRDRFTWFVAEWMGKVNPLYGESSLAYLIYDSWRCGVMHQATLKKGFETSSYSYPRDKHLYYMEDNDRIFIHSLQFADDFIEAQKKYRRHINDNAADVAYIELLYRHLSNMLGEYKSITRQKFEQFTQFLKDSNLVFNSIPKSTTCLPTEDSLSAIPSAAPEEDDLELI